MLPITHPEIDKYIEKVATEEDPILVELDRATHFQENLPHMLSGHPQGLFLTILAKSMNAKNILEIGTFTGYAAIALAKGMDSNGQLNTIEIDDEKEDIIQKFINKANLNEIIKLHIGEALDIIPSLDDEIDIIFIDADKMNNDAYFELCLPKLRSGGLLLIDNVLWKGNVADPEINDKMTKAIMDFNIKVTSDKRVQSCILPLRDGILMAQKL
ncbi:O-methyltransferase [Flammeovirga kamogawensis]|uniref:O-methyltransferase n=1 Tax=Flammeovirga kamogawensis TaxID=373891 RepID=A0ABX8GWD3_9BACT|nr:O-methyltransferase [Flammeovirga kamogawensis]MBB6461571.1 putative O-methyltransferase YrrM [Flammeovirga kamogawensis]QWG07497.1 O-methyltransferase [Flammeovirga kamogawensis]TRX69310.1 O-methyltransferase [Flammeovirga kamogawensis]